jgi:nicotinamidase-related amidase
MQFDLTNSRTALLVLDLQELFSSADGPFENKGADELIGQVNSFSSYCHTMNIPVIYSRYLFRDDLSDAGLLIDNPVVQQGHFCESSEWMQLDKRLKLAESSIRLQRNRPGAFWNNELEQTLKHHDIDTLLLCGLSVNNAVSTTAREAFARDYPTVVIRECTGAAPWETELDSYFDTLHTWTAEVTSIDDIKKRLDKNQN